MKKLKVVLISIILISFISFYVQIDTKDQIPRLKFELTTLEALANPNPDYCIPCHEDCYDSFDPHACYDNDCCCEPVYGEGTQFCSLAKE